MAKVKTVNVGLIGAGRIGSFHGESLAKRIVDAELVAVADPAPSAAAKLADKLGVDASYTDVAEMLAQPGLDAVIIATPLASTPTSWCRPPKLARRSSAKSRWH